MQRACRVIGSSAILLLLGSLTGLAQWPTTNEVTDLTDLGVEELMRVTVTSVSKGPQSWFRAPAAVHVLSGEQIRRSGATSLAEVLRWIPGMDVARVDSHTWAISVRGLNSVFSRFLLVLIDGREVYTPMFAGVFWDTQDTLLADIDRIEVIRGPGATLWGANAVNGVINIITKPAQLTQGTLLSTGAGTEEQFFGAVRWGTQPSANSYLRIYGKGFVRDDGGSALRSAHDDWWQKRGGARWDWFPNPADHFTLQSELYQGQAAQSFLVAENGLPRLLTERIDLEGGHLLGRWRHQCSNDAELSLQSWYDHTRRQWTMLEDHRETIDLEVQCRFPIGGQHHAIAGASYRRSCDRSRGSQWVSFDPATESLHWAGGLVQVDLALVPARLQLSLGSKLEHNDYTGWELQPGGRLAFTPNSRQTFWAAVARAVRTPARADTDLRFAQEPIAPFVVPVIYGNRHFAAEKLLAFELGQRWQITPQLMSDLALFYNEYNDIRSAEIQGYVFPELRIQQQNGLFGNTYGGECVLRWEIQPWCRLEGQYRLLRTDFDAVRASTDSNRERNAAQHQGALRWAVDLPRGVEVDLGVRAVEALAAQQVPGYVSLDLRLAWRPRPWLDLELVGLNLLDPEHPEFPSLFTIQRTEVQRSFHGRLTWRF